MDARIIAATKKKFEKETEGRFREDLYYRLSVIPDSFPVANAARISAVDATSSNALNDDGKPIEGILPEVDEIDLRLAGNVRELENIRTWWPWCRPGNLSGFRPTALLVTPA